MSAEGGGGGAGWGKSSVVLLPDFLLELLLTSHPFQLQDILLVPTKACTFLLSNSNELNSDTFYSLFYSYFI